MDKRLLALAVAGLTNNPVMVHMRRVAFTPIAIKDTKDIPIAAQFDRQKEAEAKRLRKQARNIKNAQKQTS